jgi:hypothetical protein
MKDVLALSFLLAINFICLHQFLDKSIILFLESKNVIIGKEATNNLVNPLD